MGVSRRSVTRVGAIIALALAGAAVMASVDRGGTMWLKFALYAISVVAGYFLTLLAPAQGCGWPFRRQPKS